MLSVAVTVTLSAATEVELKDPAAVLRGDEVTFTNEVVVFGCMAVAFGPGVVNTF